MFGLVLLGALLALFVAPAAFAMWLDRARFADWLKGLASFSITFGVALFAWSDTPQSMALQGGIEELVRFGAVLVLLRRPGSPLRAALPFGLGWASGEAAAAMWLARDMFFAGTLSGYAIPANANEAKHLFMLTQWVTLLPAHVALQGILHTALTVWAVVFARNVKRLDLFLGALFLKVAGNAAILAATSPFGEDIARFAAMGGIVVLQSAIAWSVAYWLEGQASDRVQ